MHIGTRIIPAAARACSQPFDSGRFQYRAIMTQLHSLGAPNYRYGQADER